MGHLHPPWHTDGTQQISYPAVLMSITGTNIQLEKPFTEMGENVGKKGLRLHPS